MPDIEALIVAARKAWLADQFDQSLQMFREAHLAAPQDARLAVEYANYLGMRFEVAEAVEILDRLQGNLLSQPNAARQLGLAYQRAYRPDAARSCFEAAARGGCLPAAIDLAMWHERRGDLAEAESALELASAADPDAVLWRGKIAARRGHFEEARALLETAAKAGQGPTGDDEHRIAAYYELGALYDRADEPQAALDAVSQAKQLQLPKIRPHIEAARALAPIEQNFVTTASTELFAKWQRQTKHAPCALLTGPPRSGTSLVTRMLGMHEQVAVADEMEAYSTYLQPRMLAGQSGTSAADVLDSLDSSRLGACRETYFRWMSAALDCDLDGKVLLDKFPSTTFLVPAFRRLFPNAVIIVVLRDPRDVVLSCYLRHLALNPVSAMFCKLELAVRRCCAEWKAWLMLRERLPQPWVEIRYEDVVAERYHGLAEAMEKMGLSWDDRFAGFQASLAANPVRSPTYAQLREPITKTRIARWRLYEEFLKPQLSVLEEFASGMGFAR